MALFSQGLLPASFRGVPFGVAMTDELFGRRVALHTYPGRDVPWAEDMGRAPRRFRLRGFIVDGDVVYVGGPIQVQRLLLKAAAEKSGSGTLIHPTFGVINVSCLSCAFGEALDGGRVSEVSFEFVESGKKNFLSVLTSDAGVLSAANLAKASMALDFVRVVAVAVSLGGSRSDGRTVSAQMASSLTSAATDATSLTRLTSVLSGSFGRFSTGANVGFVGSNASPYAEAASVADLAAIATASREAITTAAADLDAVYDEIGTTATDADVAAAIAALVDAMIEACANPADAVRLLGRLLSVSATGVAAASGIGIATAAAFRRAIAAALGRAASQYQPQSYDDAFAIMADVASLLNDQATFAADAGDDESFKALRALRSEVIKDLRGRGASLSRVRSVSTSSPAPAVALAQRLYRDPSRSDQLAAQVNPRHPLFMPVEFKALAA